MPTAKKTLAKIAKAKIQIRSCEQMCHTIPNSPKNIGFSILVFPAAVKKKFFALTKILVSVFDKKPQEKTSPLVVALKISRKWGDCLILVQKPITL